MTPGEKIAEVANNPQPGDVLDIRIGHGPPWDYEFLRVTDVSTRVVGVTFGESGMPYEILRRGWQKLCRRPGTDVVSMATRGES